MIMIMRYEMHKPRHVLQRQPHSTAPSSSIASVVSKQLVEAAAAAAPVVSSATLISALTLDSPLWVPGHSCKLIKWKADPVVTWKLRMMVAMAPEHRDSSLHHHDSSALHQDILTASPQDDSSLRHLDSSPPYQDILTESLQNVTHPTPK